MIVVLGMHRSGTSAITRGLETLGVSLGDHLMGPAPHNNERGFFEDLDIYALNERLLSKARSNWHRLAPLDSAWSGPDFSRERREAAELLSRKSNAATFGFKDPRTALLLPFWQCVFEDLEYDDRYLIAVRNPMETALSLESRDNLALAKGAMLWAKHLIAALRHTEGKQRVLVSFDRLLDSPVTELQRIASALALSAPVETSEALRVYTDEFLSAELRHKRVGRGELRRSGIAPPFVADLYDALNALAGATPGKTIDPDAWRSILARFEEFSPFLGYVDELDAADQRGRDALKHASKQAEALDAALAGARGDLGAALTARDQLAKDLAAAQTTIADIKATEAEGREALSAAKRRIGDLEAVLAASETNLANAHLGRDQVAAHLEEARVHLSQLRASAKRRSRRLAALIEALATRVHVEGAAKAKTAAELEASRALADKEAKLRAELAKQVVDVEANPISLDARENLARSLGAVAATLSHERARADAAERHLAALSEQQASAAAKRAAVSKGLDELAAAMARSHMQDEGAAAQWLAQLEVLQLRYAEVARRNTELEAVAKSVAQAHAEALEQLAAELHDFSLARAEAETEKAALQAERDDLRERVGIAETAAAQLKARLEEATEGAARDAKTRDQETKRLADALERERQDRSRLEAQSEDALARARADAVGAQKQFRDVRRELLLARAALTALRRSTSWRLTAPLRVLARTASNPVASARKGAAALGRRAWRSLPMPAEQRGRLAARFFAIVPPPLMSWSRTYRAWSATHGDNAAKPKADDPGEPAPDPALEGYVPLLAGEPPATVSARAIAFYLPQFHPIPENDAWWGKGFTEWTKVRAATPHFEGHYQPHEPGELGYYDLIEDEGVMARQAELARLHGLSGFCFYFYWFAGKRLLEAPIQKFAESDIDFPYCLCWANENWTRRWDGQDNEVLIAQQHSLDDDIAFIAHVSRHFSDQRYIRINGRPLLIVYRPALLPSATATAERWRRWLRQNGFGEVYLAYTQSFERAAPSDYGFDAAIEFPPNNFGLVSDPGLAAGRAAGSRLSTYDWKALSAHGRSYATAPYKLFRGVTPSWDNTPRRGENGAVFVNTTPSGFSAWLANAVRDTVARFSEPEERLIFINAWNEWAEGAYLEPDAKYGYAWLEATRRALAPDAQKPKLIVVTHDLHKHGAQFIALNIVRTLRRRFGVQTSVIAGQDGALAEAFRQEGELTITDRRSLSAADVEATIASIAARGFRHAIVNSAASAWIAPALSRAGVRHIGLVHELPEMLESLNLKDDLRVLDERAEELVFPAAIVRDRDAAALGIQEWRNASVHPQGLYKAGAICDLAEKETARRQVCTELGLSPSSRIVLGVGFADRRKGPDTFIAWARAASARWPDLCFVWVGEVATEMRDQIERALTSAGASRSRIRFIGYREATADLFKAASVYALTSREDPYPSTALEAFAAGTPVVMIKGAGGIEELAPRSFVQVVPDASPSTFVGALSAWLNNDATRQSAAISARDFIRGAGGYATYAASLADRLGLAIPNISVVVPNYNYARHLPQRLESILSQTLSPREIIFLDDASSDDSVAVAERVLSQAAVSWQVVVNDRNSGSVFAQWRRGVDLAEGDLVWVAEADDWADPRFLETASWAFRRSDVALSMTQSHQVSADGAVLARDYLDYVSDVSPSKWRRAFVGDGLTEIREGLSVKNTIPNASAVLFRREALAATLRDYERDIGAYRVAGDWCVYVNLLRKGALAYTPAALNFHRRHGHSVTISRFGLQELAELARMQAYVAREFSPDPVYAVRARAYLETLVAQFELKHRFSAAEIEGAMRGVVTAAQQRA
jgi:glycosyltransferase involved in cell wall biosynthesis